MKKWIGWIIAIFALIAISQVVTSSMRSGLEQSLSQACYRPVTIRSARVILPVGILLTGIDVPKVKGEVAAPFSVEAIRATLSLNGLGQGQAAAALEIRSPSVYLEWTRELKKAIRGGGLLPQQQAGVPVSELTIQNGHVILKDETVLPPSTWDLQQVKAHYQISPQQNYEYSISGILFDDSGKEQGTLTVDGSGVVDQHLEIHSILEHSDVRKISGYFRDVLGAMPDQGSLKMESRITIKNGVALAHNEVTAENLRFPVDAQTTIGMDGNRLVQLLSDAEGKFHLAFNVTGKLGENMDWSDLAASAMRETLQQAMARGIQKALESNNDAMPASESLQNSMDSLGR